jgi:hypothetical protein
MRQFCDCIMAARYVLCCSDFGLRDILSRRSMPCPEYLQEVQQEVSGCLGDTVPAKPIQHSYGPDVHQENQTRMLEQTRDLNTRRGMAVCNMFWLPAENSRKDKHCTASDCYHARFIYNRDLVGCATPAERSNQNRRGVGAKCCGTDLV